MFQSSHRKENSKLQHAHANRQCKSNVNALSVNTGLARARCTVYTVYIYISLNADYYRPYVCPISIPNKAMSIKHTHTLKHSLLFKYTFQSLKFLISVKEIWCDLAKKKTNYWKHVNKNTYQKHIYAQMPARLEHTKPTLYSTWFCFVARLIIYHLIDLYLIPLGWEIVPLVINTI